MSSLILSFAGKGEVIDGWDVGLEGSCSDIVIFLFFSSDHLLSVLIPLRCLQTFMVLRYASGRKEETHNPTINGVCGLYSIFCRVISNLVWLSHPYHLSYVHVRFGSEGHGEKIPPNSWLVYDFELAKVHWLIFPIGHGWFFFWLNLDWFWKQKKKGDRRLHLTAVFLLNLAWFRNRWVWDFVVNIQPNLCLLQLECKIFTS